MLETHITLKVKTEEGRELIFTEGQSITINSWIKNQITGEKAPFVVETTLKEIITHKVQTRSDTYRGVLLELVINKFIDTPFDKPMRRGEFRRYYIEDTLRLELEYFASSGVSGLFHNIDTNFVEKFLI